MDLETQHLGNGILNFGPCSAQEHRDFCPVGRDGVLYLLYIFFAVTTNSCICIYANSMPFWCSSECVNIVCLKFRNLS